MRATKATTTPRLTALSVWRRAERHGSIGPRALTSSRAPIWPVRAPRAPTAPTCTRPRGYTISDKISAPRHSSTRPRGSTRLDSRPPWGATEPWWAPRVPASLVTKKVATFRRQTLRSGRVRPIALRCPTRRLAMVRRRSSRGAMPLGTGARCRPSLPRPTPSQASHSPFGCQASRSTCTDRTLGSCRKCSALGAMRPWWAKMASSSR